MTNLIYTLQLCRFPDDVRHGPIHGADCDRETLCGRIITDKYWYLTTDGTGAETVTCKRCRKALTKGD